MITDFFGAYAGIGWWHEADGKSAAYRVAQTIQPTAEGFQVAFRHQFDDGNVVAANDDSRDRAADQHRAGAEAWPTIGRNIDRIYVIG